jgi:hypothetical protein
VDQDLERILKRLKAILDSNTDRFASSLLNRLLEAKVGTLEFWDLAASLDVWGGSGSIADQAGMAIKDREQQKQFCKLMAEFADHVSARKPGTRAEFWGSAFRKWSS